MTDEPNEQNGPNGPDGPDGPDKRPARGRPPLRRLVIACLGALLLVAVALSVRFAIRDRTASYEDPSELFKYGSIGAEARYGIPLPIFRALPRLCGKMLPAMAGARDYESYGFLYERPDSPVPIGFSIREKPIPLVGLNCAACHTATYRTEQKGPRKAVLGGPGQQVDIEQFARFLFHCVESDAFTPDAVVAQMRKDGSISPLEAPLYRHVVVPRTKAAFAAARPEFAWLMRPVSSGPGLLDAATMFRALLHRDLPAPGGAAKIPPLFLSVSPQGRHYDWDGGNDSVESIADAFALLVGATPESLDTRTIARVLAWLRERPVPRWPGDAKSVVAWRVDLGRELFRMYCASCHEKGSAGYGQVTPRGTVGTDPRRSLAWDEALVDGLDGLGAGRSFRTDGFHATDGYVAGPLDGAWLRGPYLHNGSVWSVRDLLEPPEKRVTRIAHGNDVLDPRDGAFRTFGCRTGERGDCFLNEIGGSVGTTQSAGAGNFGHEYGTRLSDDDKLSLVEYLKTL